jgi:hypothetical protein
MIRDMGASFDEWLGDRGRKPLVLRGARQVGKTWLVRDLCARSGRALVEINFERDPGMRRHFASNDPRKVLAELSLTLGSDVAPARSLLFLDEIQAVPEMLAKLRWFSEELPELPVVAAGSLMDLMLTQSTFHAPVGRIRCLHVEPMGFSEYLRAHGQDRLWKALDGWRPGGKLSPAAHEQATAWFHRYGMVGGMPAVVNADVEGRGARACRELQKDLVATYRDDFAKYGGRMDRTILDATLAAAARSLGRKFVYARVDQAVKQHQARHALELLAQARLCHLVRHSSANGLPLAGEMKDNLRKVVLLDVGLLHALLGTPALSAFPDWRALAPQVRGQMSEQLAGQQLRLLDSAVGDGPALCYWQREGGRPGEIDYLLQLAGRIVPIETKAGSVGAMKSLHQFMFDKRLDLAVRLDDNPPSVFEVSVKTTQGNPVKYRLLSLPLYLVWLLPAALETIAK